MSFDSFIHQAFIKYLPDAWYWESAENLEMKDILLILAQIMNI